MTQSEKSLDEKLKNVKKMNDKIFETINRTIYMSDDDKMVPGKDPPFSFQVKEGLGLFRNKQKNPKILLANEIGTAKDSLVHDSLNFDKN